MASLPSTLFSQSLPPHCIPTTPFLTQLSEYTGTCIPTPLAFLSTLLGSLSIVSWLFAQMPQIYKNYQLKSTAGLSIFFLGEWLLGDATNLTGAILTKQAGWQVVVASYYVFVDVCLVVQYFWYTYYARRVYGESLHSSCSSQRDGDSDSINALSPINSNFVTSTSVLFKDDGEDRPKSPNKTVVDGPFFSQVNYEKGASTPPQDIQFNDKLGSGWLGTVSPRTLMFAATMSSLVSTTAAAPLPFPKDHYRHGIYLFRIDTPLEIVGTIVSWCSTLLYLGSRLPQLHKNWKRKSTSGLSPLLFFAAFCGNFFYSTSLMTNPFAWDDYGPNGYYGWADEDGSQRLAWIARAAPFFLGAAGVLIMDALMGVQFMMYDDRELAIVRVRDGHGHSKWQQVNGWMRGWIPSMTGKQRVVDLAESQRLLGEAPHMSMSRRSTRDYGTT